MQGSKVLCSLIAFVFALQSLTVAEDLAQLTEQCTRSVRIQFNIVVHECKLLHKYESGEQDTVDLINDNDSLIQDYWMGPKALQCVSERLMKDEFLSRINSKCIAKLSKLDLMGGTKCLASEVTKLCLRYKNYPKSLIKR